MKKYALLDMDNVVTGFVDQDDDVAAPDGAIEVSLDCDLVAGGASWLPDAKYFKIHPPVGLDEEGRIDRLMTLPETVRAFAGALMAIRDGKPLPAETLEWLSAYEKSFDGMPQ